MSSNSLALKMITHASAAAIIFFVFQRYALASNLETAALWAGVGAIAAGALALSQHRRGQ